MSAFSLIAETLLAASNACEHRGVALGSSAMVHRVVGGHEHKAALRDLVHALLGKVLRGVAGELLGKSEHANGMCE